MEEKWKQTKGYKRLIRSSFFLMYLLLFLFGVWQHGPTIWLYVDQAEGTGKLSYLSKQKAHIDYFHEKQNREVQLQFKIRDLGIYNKLKEKKRLKIVYSKNFPTLVRLVEFDGDNTLLNLAALVIYAIPLLYYKRLADDPD